MAYTAINILTLTLFFTYVIEFCFIDKQSVLNQTTLDYNWHLLAPWIQLICGSLLLIGLVSSYSTSIDYIWSEKNTTLNMGAPFKGYQENVGTSLRPLKIIHRSTTTSFSRRINQLFLVVCHVAPRFFIASKVFPNGM